MLYSYFLKNGVIELKADSNVETIWASQKQIAQVFDVTPQNITIHLINASLICCLGLLRFEPSPI
jgi:hypothetical protein